MTALFIDSTYDIGLGLLKETQQWIHFERFFGQKASSIIQNETHNLLSKHSLKVSDLTSIITIAGPGFYTGLRLSEGFADVLSFLGISHYSFLSYDIPLLSGVDSGVWMTKAYRGEYFFHHWKDNESHNILIAANKLESYLNTLNMSSFYIHSVEAIDKFALQYLKEWKTTYGLLENAPQSIFAKVLTSKSKVDSFYFRAPEDEFKVSV